MQENVFKIKRVLQEGGDQASKLRLNAYAIKEVQEANLYD